MVETLRKEVEIYRTIDNVEFLNKEDAVWHEKAVTTQYVLVDYAPDLNDTGRLTKCGLIEIVNGHDFSEDYAADFCFNKFGSKIAYIQGVHPTINWDIREVYFYADYIDLNNKYEIIGKFEETKGRGY